MGSLAATEASPKHRGLTVSALSLLHFWPLGWLRHRNAWFCAETLPRTLQSHTSEWCRRADLNRGPTDYECGSGPRADYRRPTLTCQTSFVDNALGDRQELLSTLVCAAIRFRVLPWASTAPRAEQTFSGLAWRNSKRPARCDSARSQRSPAMPAARIASLRNWYRAAAARNNRSTSYVANWRLPGSSSVASATMA